MRRAAQSSRPDRGPRIDYAFFVSLGFSSVILNGSTRTFGTLLAPATKSPTVRPGQFLLFKQINLKHLVAKWRNGV
jgi:hypothetical protein